MRALGLVLVLVLAGCSVDPPHDDPTTAVPTPPTTVAPPVPTATPEPSPTPEPEPRTCARGVRYADVLGPRPRVVGRAAGPVLRKSRVAGAVCAAYWVPHLDDYFTPQSLEIAGNVAYVGGYRWSRNISRRPCQIAVMDTRNGRVLAFVKKFQAPVYGPEPTYCRHAGGMELTSHGLWVAELERLWLLDPAKLGTGDPVIRVWRLDRSVRGATMLIHGNRLGFGSYRAASQGRLVWFDLDQVLAPGRTLLKTPVAVQAVPVRLQGITSTSRGLWFSSSDAHCANLDPPGRRPVTFVHGAEDVEIVGEDLWTVSEAGVRAYLHGRDRIVPSLLRLDKAAVLAGPPATCTW